MQEGISGYCKPYRKVWFYDGYGSWSWLFCLLCLDYYYKDHRSGDRQYEENDYKIDRPTSPIRPRYDTITTKGEYRT